jgi:hypothetical protein
MDATRRRDALELEQQPVELNDTVSDNATLNDNSMLQFLSDSIVLKIFGLHYLSIQ